MKNYSQRDLNQKIFSKQRKRFEIDTTMAIRWIPIFIGMVIFPRQSL
jgi:hypothetical protein